jgi:hypothetical protein
MLRDMPIEVVLAAGYGAVVILLVAALEAFARLAAWRTHRYHAAGFVYHGPLDAWRCPAGEWLRLHAVDDARRVSRYRAPAEACRVCALRGVCGPGESGREVERAWGDWLEFELGRFHRAVSLVVLAVAAVVLLIEMARFPARASFVVLATAFVVVAAAGCRLAARLSAAGRPSLQRYRS